MTITTSKEDYLALFDWSDEAFTSTGGRCWLLFDDWMKHVETGDEDYIFPFECSDEDKDAATEWLTLAEQVQVYSLRSHSIYRKTFYRNINPRGIIDAKPCTRCSSGPLVPIPQAMLSMDLAIDNGFVCVVCLCSS